MSDESDNFLSDNPIKVLQLFPIRQISTIKCSFDNFQKLYENLRCTICRDIFRSPVYMRCSHRFCKDCIQKYIRLNDKKSCPVCRGELATKRDLRTDYRLISLINYAFGNALQFQRKLDKAETDAIDNFKFVRTQKSIQCQFKRERPTSLNQQFRKIEATPSKKKKNSFDDILDQIGSHPRKQPQPQLYIPIQLPLKTTRSDYVLRSAQPQSQLQQPRLSESAYIKNPEWNSVKSKLKRKKVAFITIKSSSEERQQTPNVNISCPLSPSPLKVSQYKVTSSKQQPIPRKQAVQLFQQPAKQALVPLAPYDERLQVFPPLLTPHQSSHSNQDQSKLGVNPFQIVRRVKQTNTQQDNSKPNQIALASQKIINIEPRLSISYNKNFPQNSSESQLQKKAAAQISQRKRSFNVTENKSNLLPEKESNTNKPFQISEKQVTVQNVQPLNEQVVQDNLTSLSNKHKNGILEPVLAEVKVPPKKVFSTHHIYQMQIASSQKLVDQPPIMNQPFINIDSHLQAKNNNSRLQTNSKEIAKPQQVQLENLASLSFLSKPKSIKKQDKQPQDQLIQNPGEDILQAQRILKDQYGSQYIRKLLQRMHKKCSLSIKLQKRPNDRMTPLLTVNRLVVSLHSNANDIKKLIARKLNVEARNAINLYYEDANSIVTTLQDTQMTFLDLMEKCWLSYAGVQLCSMKEMIRLDHSPSQSYASRVLFYSVEVSQLIR